MLVIVASKIDPHADAVIEELREQGIPLLRIDLESALFDFEISVTPGLNGIRWSIADSAMGRLANESNIRTVWWRRGNSYPNGRPPLTRDRIDQEEARNVARWLLETLPAEKYPFGHPLKIRAAENKMAQLDAAIQAGFVVPDYVFTNQRPPILEFIKSKDKAVVKSLTLSVYSENGKSLSFRAACLPKNKIQRFRADGQPAVAFAQDLVERDYDVRAFVHRDFHHACKIYVKNLPEGVVDWRPFTFQCAHEKHELSEETLSLCRSFLHRLDIPCGHFDFIVDRADAEWFLECNPNGQWYWLEKMAGCTIAKEVCRVLTDHYSKASV